MGMVSVQDETAEATLPNGTMIGLSVTEGSLFGGKNGFWADGIYEYSKEFDVS